MEVEHVVIDGINHPLLPLRSSILQKHQAPSWNLPVANRSYWHGVDINAQPLPDAAAAEPSTAWQGQWAAVSGADFNHPAAPACGPGCTVHTEAFHDSLILLRKRTELPAQFIQLWQPERTDEVLRWLVQQQSPLSPTPSPVPVADQAHPPVPPTRQSAELLRVCRSPPSRRGLGTLSFWTDRLPKTSDVNLISRYKASLGGNPDIATNPYMKHYIPFCLHSPLLAQIAICTAACFLNDTCPDIVDNTTAMTRKGAAIYMLKTHLRTTGSTTDEAIAGVTQLILNEWHWGDRGELEAHFGGLKEMVRSRGGLSSLGLGGLLSKLVIVTDITIALFFEIEPYLQGGPEFEFREAAPQLPFSVSPDTPLVSPFVPRDARAGHVEPHEAAARILDDMRFLIGLVLALAEDEPSPKDLQKVQTTSRWIHDRISELPAAYAPVTQQHSDAEVLPGPTSATSTTRSCTFPVPSHPRRRSPGQHSPQDLCAPGPWSWPQGSGSSAHARGPFPGGGGGTDHHPSHDPPPCSPHPGDGGNDDSTATATPDIIYQAVRQSALIYSRAIMLRRPLGDAGVCGGEDFVRLWTTVWRCPLRAWGAVLGVFAWVLLCITPASRGTPHERFVKGMLEVALVQTALESWDVADRGMAAALRLTRWLARGGRGETDG